MTNSAKIILGIAGAAVAGVAIGMLLAPEKGGDARKKIADNISDFICRIGDLLSAGKEKIAETGNSTANQARTWADDIIEKTKDKTEGNFA